MKSLLKKRYLVSALSLAIIGSASASSLQIQVTSSQPGFGDGSGCTLQGAIEVARTQNIAPHQAHGCHNNIIVFQGNGPSLIWADKTQVTNHQLTQTQVLDFPVIINLSKAKLNGAVIDSFPAYNFLLPPVRVNTGWRHFKIMNTTVTLQGMDLREAYYSSQLTYSGYLPAANVLEEKLGGGSTFVKNANFNADHVRFSYNQVGNSVGCVKRLDFLPAVSKTKSYSNWDAYVMEPMGTALKILGSTVNFTDVSFENNAPYFTNFCDQGAWSDRPYNRFVSGTVYAERSSVTLQRARFLNNEADYGSAIAFRGNDRTKHKLTMKEVEIRNNLATTIHHDPMLDHDSSAPMLVGEQNAFIRTAIDIVGATADLTFVSLKDNLSAGLSAYKSDVTMKQSAIYNNALHAVLNQDSNVTVENTLISKNLSRLPIFATSISPDGNTMGYGITLLSYNLVANNISNSISPTRCHSSNTFSNAIVYTTPLGSSSPCLDDATIPNQTKLIHTTLINDGKVSNASSANWEVSSAIISRASLYVPFPYNDFHITSSLGSDVYATFGSGSVVLKSIPSGFMKMPVYQPPAGSMALEREAICSVSVDQLGQSRLPNPCDSGAIEVQ